MKRTVFVLTVTIALSLVAFSQLGCQTAGDTKSTASSGSAANSNAGKESVDPAAVEKELLRIERDWPRVIKEKDVASVRRVEADDIILIYPDGTLGNKEQDLKDIESGALTADTWEVTDLKVKVLDNDSAVVSGLSIVKGGKYKAPDGKVTDLSGQYRFIDTFAKRNGQWQLVASASTPVKQPIMASSPAKTVSTETKPPAPPAARPKT
jgi:hypothetical protein